MQVLGLFTVGHLSESKESIVVGVLDGLLGVTLGQVCASGLAGGYLGGIRAISMVVRLNDKRCWAVSVFRPEAGAREYYPRVVKV